VIFLVEMDDVSVYYQSKAQEAVEFSALPLLRMMQVPLTHVMPPKSIQARLSLVRPSIFLQSLSTVTVLASSSGCLRDAAIKNDGLG